MLNFSENEIVISRDKVETCNICTCRRASWRSVSVDGGEMEPMCGWCILYSGKSKWGYENRDEILYVGRASQEIAAKNMRDIPALDGRGRLDPIVAERFLFGVAFTSKISGRLSAS